jgi:hypothetical protein
LFALALALAFALALASTVRASALSACCGRVASVHLREQRQLQRPTHDDERNDDERKTTAKSVSSSSSSHSSSKREKPTQEQLIAYNVADSPRDYGVHRDESTPIHVRKRQHGGQLHRTPLM